MGRTPCCENMMVRKGPWTKEEDQILISYINAFGHANWRAVPRKAGLLRCGKSCRLRWMNYLRPDIKRGPFTREEEATIVKLHETLGNRWACIAARLPGRTDNEIKNVWHTHLKKRLHEFARPAANNLQVSNNLGVVKNDNLGVVENDNLIGIPKNDSPVIFAAAAGKNDPATNLLLDSSSAPASGAPAAANSKVSGGLAGLVESDFPVLDDDEFWKQVNDTCRFLSVEPDNDQSHRFDFNPMENGSGGPSSDRQYWQNLLTWIDE